MSDSPLLEWHPGVPVIGGHDQHRGTPPGHALSLIEGALLLSSPFFRALGRSGAEDARNNLITWLHRHALSVDTPTLQDVTENDYLLFKQQLDSSATEAVQAVVELSRSGPFASHLSDTNDGEDKDTSLVPHFFISSAMALWPLVYLAVELELVKDVIPDGGTADSDDDNACLSLGSIAPYDRCIIEDCNKDYQQMTSAMARLHSGNAEVIAKRTIVPYTYAFPLPYPSAFPDEWGGDVYLPDSLYSLTHRARHLIAMCAPALPLECGNPFVTLLYQFVTRAVGEILLPWMERQRAHYESVLNNRIRGKQSEGHAHSPVAFSRALPDLTPFADALLRALLSAKVNAHRSQAQWALLPRGSKLAHSCCGNLLFVPTRASFTPFRPDDNTEAAQGQSKTLFVAYFIATRDIKPGSLLSFSYLGGSFLLLLDYYYRRKRLSLSHLFCCTCYRCRGGAILRNHSTAHRLPLTRDGTSASDTNQRAFTLVMKSGNGIACWGCRLDKQQRATEDGADNSCNNIPAYLTIGLAGVGTLIRFETNDTDFDFTTNGRTSGNSDTFDSLLLTEHPPWCCTVCQRFYYDADFPKKMRKVIKQCDQFISPFLDAIAKSNRFDPSNNDLDNELSKSQPKLRYQSLKDMLVKVEDELGPGNQYSIAIIGQIVHYFKLLLNIPFSKTKSNSLSPLGALIAARTLPAFFIWSTYYLLKIERYMGIGRVFDSSSAFTGLMSLEDAIIIWPLIDDSNNTGPPYRFLHYPHFASLTTLTGLAEGLLAVLSSCINDLDLLTAKTQARLTNEVDDEVKDLFITFFRPRLLGYLLLRFVAVIGAILIPSSTIFYGIINTSIRGNRGTQAATPDDITIPHHLVRNEVLLERMQGAADMCAQCESVITSLNRKATGELFSLLVLLTPIKSLIQEAVQCRSFSAVIQLWARDCLRLAALFQVNMVKSDISNITPSSPFSFAYFELLERVSEWKGETDDLSTEVLTIF